MAVNHFASVRRILRRHCDTACVAFVSAALFVMAFPAVAPAQALPAFNWMLEVDNSGLGYNFAGLGTDALGNVYIVGSTKSLSFPVKNAVQSQSASPGSYDVIVTKVDPSGNVVYATYFGGGADDIATAMAVDPAGNVYVAGTTVSNNFPTGPGSYSRTPPTAGGATFLFRLNPDGSVGYSTYFAYGSGTMPQAMAVDDSGSAYLTGYTFKGVPTTPGAYLTTCGCGQWPPPGSGPGIERPHADRPGTIYWSDGFLTKFAPDGSKLVYSTYLGISRGGGNAIAVAPDGSAYVGGQTGTYRLDPTGSTRLASINPVVNAQAIAIGPDGNVYLAGEPGHGPDQFQPTGGAFESSPGARPPLPGQGLRRLRSESQSWIRCSRTRWQPPISAIPGYRLSVNALALDSSGNVYFGGRTQSVGLPTRTPLQEGFGGSLATGFVSELSADLSTLLFSSQFGDGEYFGVTGLGIGSNGSFALAGPTDHGTLWANGVQPADLPPLRIDAVENAASLLDGPLAAGETIVVRGAGFASDAQLLIGGAAVPLIAVTPNQITAAVPSDLPNQPVFVQVQSGGAVSNQVALNVATTSPGLFSADGSGFGQAYILNQDGTLNSPAHPAAPGDKIVVYATGVGVGVILTIDGASSQYGLAISIKQ
jgi:hypothetical protein